MDTAALIEIGLSPGEVAIYLSLLQNGPGKARAIIEHTAMASSAIYNALNTLLEKGLVSTVKKGKIKEYSAVPPTQLIAFAEERKKRLASLLPELEATMQLAQTKEEAEVFIGFKGVTTMLDQLLASLESGDDNLFFTTKAPDTQEVHTFFKKYDARRKERGVITRGIAHAYEKPFITARKQEGADMDVRYPPFPFPEGINIGKNMIGIVSWGEKPVGYLLRSTQITAGYTKLFNDIWEQCEDTT